jgi:hypothetical protein
MTEQEIHAVAKEELADILLADKTSASTAVTALFRVLSRVASQAKANLREEIVKPRSHPDDLTEEKVRSLFNLTGIPVLRIWELPNGYWPKTYLEERARDPWWLVLTSRGPIEIGWRKRVIHIAWDATDIRLVVTEDEVTKSETNVHAWTMVKAVEYLTTLGEVFRPSAAKATTVEETL